MRKKIFEIVEEAQPDGTLVSRLYDYLMFAAITVGIIPLMFKGTEPWMVVMDVTSCAIFSIDYLLRWCTADFRSEGKKASAFIAYPFTLLAVMDLLTILPTFSLINASFKLFRLGRLLRILRVARVFRYYKPIQIMLAVVRKERVTLLTVLSFAAIYIFVTALIMFNAEVEVDPVTGEPVFSNFFDAVYWAACTLTTVGYGDICPVSWVGRLISMMSAIMGVAIIALPSGIITAAYLEELKGWHTKGKDQNE